MQIPIIYQDQDIIVVNKPPGLIVNKADSVKEETLQDWVATNHLSKLSSESWETLVPADFNSEFGTPEQVFAERQGIVHRLDKDTSGILVLAKSPGSLVNLLAQFKNRTTTKEYRCLVHGKFNLTHGTVALPLARSSRDRRHFTVDLEGRVAVTEYFIEKWYKKLNITKLEDHLDPQLINIYQQGFSLITCLPKTGRTHQIRVHLAAIQHPLVGDTTYVGRKRAKLDPIWCPRQFLHAAKLGFQHPRTGEQLSFTAELSTDLQKTLSYLQD